MTGGAQGGIDQNRAGSVRCVNGQRRGEQFHTALQQDRNVSVVRLI